MNETAVEQIYCVLINLVDETLLLPNAVVAESVSHDQLKADGAGPRWLSGSMVLNNRRLPVLNFESLNGGTLPPLGRRSRLVIMHPISERGEESPFALVSQGYPHLVTLNRTALTPLPLRTADRGEFVLARVRIGNTQTLIPDLDHLSALLLQARTNEVED